VNTSEKVKMARELLDQCSVLARQFVKLVDIESDLYYSLVTLRENGFRFNYGHKTDGKARHAELPYTLLDAPEQLKVLAEEEKEKIERHLKNSRCDNCGAFKVHNYWI
jgi:hypothetical protein